MRVELMFPSRYVKAIDLDGKPHTVTIDRVVTEKLQRVNGKADKGYVVYFRNAKKGLVLNKTNATTIAKLHGNETDNWGGKQVTLFPSTCEAFGETVDCIRVKTDAPRPGPKTELTPAEVQDAFGEAASVDDDGHDEDEGF